MKMQSVLVAGALGAAILVGCTKEPEAATPAPAPGTPKPADVVKPAVDAAKNVAAAKTAEAQKLIDQATAYVKDNKLDLADSTIKQLEGMKASLPAEYQGKIDELRSLFDKAKTAMPGMPKMPGM